MTLQRHGFQTFCHVGFVDAVKVDGRAAALQNQFNHLPQISALRVPQVRQGSAALAGQFKHGFTVLVRFHVGRHRLLPKTHHFIATGVQLVGV